LQRCVKEWTPTFLGELPLGELESWWTPKFLENNCKGQNSLNRKVLYMIGKLLKRRCLKWARMTHLDTQNTSYGQKKGRGSNWQFDSQPLKVENHPDFLTCKWRAKYRWKSPDKGYNFALSFISIGGLHIKLWTFKVMKVSIFGNFGTPILESWNKMTFECWPHG